ncbi:MAG: alpha/beta family hydrolase [Devosia sp.]
MATDFLFDGPEDARVTILLAHGAGAPMDSASMTAVTKVLAASGFRVARFEFAYMAARRHGERKPPPKGESVMPEYVAAIDDLGPTGAPLIIGGKSMGGRVASMIADKEFEAKRIGGLLCLGYPFHPLGRPTVLRTKHLVGMKTPALICQGTRDQMGARDEVGDYGLSDQIEMFWLEDGDHDLKPRKTISGFTAAQHLQSLADKVTEWVARIAP